jgi:hypothetical protein
VVLDALPSHDAARAVEAVIREIVAAEGAVHLGRLAKLMAAAFDLSKVTQSRATAVLGVVPAEMKARSTEPFAWPTEFDPMSWRRARSSHQGEGRQLDHVSLVEIANAMSILGQGIGWSVRTRRQAADPLALRRQAHCGGDQHPSGQRADLGSGEWQAAADPRPSHVARADLSHSIHLRGHRQRGSAHCG